MSITSLKVDPEHHRERLDVYLTRVLEDVPSRSFVQKLLEKGCVRVNQKEAKAHYKVQHNDAVTVEIPAGALEPQPIEPEDIPLDIFYEDEWLLVVNKPCGMMVHPAQGRNSGTLVNALLFHCRQLSDLNTASRPGIVHRLDKETSGLLVVAKDNSTHAQLASQFQKHRVKKRYVALVEGEVEFDEGVIDAPLGRHPLRYDLRDIQYDDEAKEAVTFYRVIKRHEGVTLVALFPKTGRTHQLRVHMDHIGHPILGDDKYGHKTNFPRLALHAKSLGFKHPAYKCFMEFSCRTPAEFLEKVALP